MHVASDILPNRSNFFMIAEIHSFYNNL